jgi:hypothetical protein
VFLLEATAYEQVTRQMVGDLTERFDRHEEKQNSTLEKIEQRLERIERQLNGRPSWTVSTIITFLSSLCVGLFVYLVK